MIKDTVKLIERNISEDRLMDTVRDISTHHRIQGSAGYRDCAAAISGRLTRYGITNEVRAYEAAYGKNYLSMNAFNEWNCESAYCKLISPAEVVLADYGEVPMSIFQKSSPFKSAEPLDIVLMDRGSDRNRYAGVDLRGKLLFVREDFSPFLDWAVRKCGAVGFISDYVVENDGRTRNDMYNVCKYTSFWWRVEPDIKPFGFSITPKMGDWLCGLCLDTRDAHRKDNSKDKYPKAECHVDARFTKGSYENIIAEIEGETDDEIWITAHLCHPKPSANDNASGAAAAVEVLRVISSLIGNNKLNPLKRALKVILLPEFTGTYPYLEEYKHFGKVLAGLNLDMVGGKQELRYGPLTISGLSLASPSIATDLCACVLNELKNDHKTHNSHSMVPSFNSAVTDFQAGSDHFILQDPTIGIPAPMLGQWPDIFYHTSGDGIETISPAILKKSAAIAAAYAYVMCSMEYDDLDEILTESSASFTRAVSVVASRHKAGEAVDLYKGFMYLKDFYVESANNAERFFPGDEKAKSLIRSHASYIEDIRRAATKHFGAVEHGRKHTDLRVPKRKFVGPITNLHEFEDNAAGGAEFIKRYNVIYGTSHNDQRTAEILIQYHINNKNTVSEITDIVLFENHGGNAKAVSSYIDLLCNLGLCEYSTL